ncbi:MAG: LD-carboxypeptidase [Bacteroidota bacterium]|nr:LD-carboxypeptidase [Bacteroidota bacterium]
MQFPPFLKPGDQIRVISPSGKIDPNLVNGAIDRLYLWDFNPVGGRYAKGAYGRYSGTVDERLYDLMEAIYDPAVKAIVCSRGGYGAVHLLDLVDPEVIRPNPKWLIGFSDITAIHALMQNAGVASLHAPMARHLAEEDDFSAAALKQILLGEIPEYTIESHPLNREGEATGILRGGNLSVLAGLRGTKYDFPAENTILFIEEIGEEPYHVERMLYNLKMSGVLAELPGLIVGQFTNYEEDKGMFKSLYEIIYDTVSEYDYPVLFNFPVGHVAENYPLICGAKATLKIGKSSTLSFSLSE